MIVKDKGKIAGLTIVLLLGFIYLQYYMITNAYIAKKPWKYSNGANLGDIIWFKDIGHGDHFTLHGDTIYDKNRKPLAIITKRAYRFIGGNYLLIKSLPAHEEGRYCEK